MATHKRVHSNFLSLKIRISLLSFLFAFGAVSHAETTLSELLPADPESSFLESDEGLTPDFCGKWNPEFNDQDYKCCGTRQFWSSARSSSSGNSSSGTSGKGRRRRRGAPFCAPGRNGWSKCEERTPEQIQYEETLKEKIEAKVLGENDLLNMLEGRIRKQIEFKEHPQAYCSFANGFVADALPIMVTPHNRLLLNAPEGRCANYGTDYLVYLMEWLGSEIRKEYSESAFANARIVMGDSGAPKGGCLAVKRGKRGHRSHTNGQDVDIAYFNPTRLNDSEVAAVEQLRSDTKMSTAVPENLLPSRMFTTDFYVASNWWLLKKIFSEANRYSCVRGIFLDRRHIDQLARYTNSIKDPEWSKIREYIMHQPGHFNHFHLRVIPKGRGGECLSIAEWKRRGKKDGMGEGDDEGELYGDPDLIDKAGNPALSDITRESGDAGTGDDPLEDADGKESKDAPASQKPSEIFLKSQIESAKLATQEAKTGALSTAIAGIAVIPDHKREPFVSRNFPVGRGRKGKGKRKHGNSSRNPSSIKNKSSKKKRH